MRPRLSALERSYAQSCRLAVARTRAPARPSQSLLYGQSLRKLRRPLLALEISQELGPCRHAVAQRTVAGMVIVHFPPPAVPASTPKGPGSASTPEDRHA